MTRQLLRFVLIAAFLISVPSRLHATPVLIDFESFSDLDVLTTQIPEVTFSNATVLTSGAAGGSLDEFLFPPHSGFNVIFDDGGPMTIDFVSLVDSIQVFVTHSTALTASVFGAGGIPLGGGVFFTPNLGGHRELLFSWAPGISFVTLTGLPAGHSFTVDDLRFNTIDQATVPEPGTLALIGSGLALLVRQRRQAAIRRLS